MFCLDLHQTRPPPAGLWQHYSTWTASTCSHARQLLSSDLCFLSALMYDRGTIELAGAVPLSTCGGEIPLLLLLTFFSSRCPWNGFNLCQGLPEKHTSSILAKQQRS